LENIIKRSIKTTPKNLSKIFNIFFTTCTTTSKKTLQKDVPKSRNPLPKLPLPATFNSQPPSHSLLPHSLREISMLNAASQVKRYHFVEEGLKIP